MLLLSRQSAARFGIFSSFSSSTTTTRNFSTKSVVKMVRSFLPTFPSSQSARSFEKVMGLKQKRVIGMESNG